MDTATLERSPQTTVPRDRAGIRVTVSYASEAASRRDVAHLTGKGWRVLAVAPERAGIAITFLIP